MSLDSWRAARDARVDRWATTSGTFSRPELAGDDWFAGFKAGYRRAAGAHMPGPIMDADELRRSCPDGAFLLDPSGVVVEYVTEPGLSEADGGAVLLGGRLFGLGVARFPMLLLADASEREEWLEAVA